MPWSEVEFQARVTERTRERNKSLRSVFAAAGLSPDTFQKPPAQGRRIDTIEKLAAALDWSLADILGISMIGRLDPELLLLAFKLAQRGLRYVDTTDEIVIEITARVYNVLADSVRETGNKTIDKAVQDGLVAYIASEWTKRG